MLAVYGVAATAIYLNAGLGRWSPQFTPIERTLALSLGFFVVPSLCEELLWRWLLIPPGVLGKASGKSLLAVVATSLVFTAAHPLAGVYIVPHARDVFTNPAFLLIVFLLGLTCGSMYVVSKSIWPPVLTHWITVLAWKFLFGGPFVLLGR